MGILFMMGNFRFDIIFMLEHCKGLGESENGSAQHDELSVIHPDVTYSFLY